MSFNSSVSELSSWLIRLIYALSEGTSQKCCVFNRYMMLIRPITAHFNFDHLVKILFAARVAMLISDKIDFKNRAIKREPEGHFIILKGRLHQEDINTAYICTQQRNTQHIKKILEDFKKDIDSNTITVGDFNSTLSKWTGLQIKYRQGYCGT